MYDQQINSHEVSAPYPVDSNYGSGERIFFGGRPFYGRPFFHRPFFHRPFYGYGFGYPYYPPYYPPYPYYPYGGYPY